MQPVANTSSSHGGRDAPSSACNGDSTGLAQWLSTAVFFEINRLRISNTRNDAFTDLDERLSREFQSSLHRLDPQRAVLD